MYLRAHTNYSGLVNTRVGYLLLATMHYQTVDLLNRLTNQLKPGTNFVVRTILSYIYGKKNNLQTWPCMTALRGTITYKSHALGIAARSQMDEVLDFL